MAYRGPKGGADLLRTTCCGSEDVESIPYPAGLRVVGVCLAESRVRSRRLEYAASSWLLQVLRRPHPSPPLSSPTTTTTCPISRPLATHPHTTLSSIMRSKFKDEHPFGWWRTPRDVYDLSSSAPVLYRQAQGGGGAHQAEVPGQDTCTFPFSS